MAAPTLTSVSPSSGPLGTAITCLGAGFEVGARIGCPSLVTTTRTSATELHGAIPTGLVGPPGQEMVVAVFVENPDGSRSAMLSFTVRLTTSLQGWTTVAAVCAEIPGFSRTGRIADATIEGWIRSTAQVIAGAMLARGLSLDPANWQTVEDVTGMPSPAGVLELINRMGAAARLASAIASDFTQGEWGIAKNLLAEYQRELKRLGTGAYDKLFSPAAATAETGALLMGGDVENDDGDVERSFTQGQVF